MLGEAYVVVVWNSELLEDDPDDDSDDDSDDELLLLSEEVVVVKSMVVLGNAICEQKERFQGILKTYGVVIISVVETDTSDDDSRVELGASKVDELALDASSSALTASCTPPSGE